MGRLNDLTGRTFERLTVIKRGENSNTGLTRWYCKCSCGNPKLVLVVASNLKNGYTKSCGCFQKESIKEHARKMGLNSRKYFGCMLCGSDKHYAKGMCHNCYERDRTQKIRYAKERKDAV